MSSKTDLPGVIKRTILLFVCAVLVLFLSVFIFESSRNNAVKIIRALGLENASAAKILDRKVFLIDLFGGLPVGRAVMTNNGLVTLKDKEVYQCSGQAQTFGLAALLFNAQAKVSSYIDKNTLLPLLFKETLSRPDSPVETKEIVYDHENLIMEVKGIKRQILPGTQDPFSVMYYLSRQSFEPGKEFDMNINTNQKNYRFFLKVSKREEQIVNGRKIGIWIVKGDIKRRDKSPRHTTNLTMWLLDNGEKTPIFIKVVASGLPVTARLIEVQ
ncbi:MAG: DUF3108 domain-containing protein [Candidatus Omnitrophota bacterium]|jgi:hypothetical protein